MPLGVGQKAENNELIIIKLKKSDENPNDKDVEFKHKETYNSSQDNEISTLYAPNDIFQTCNKSSA